MTEGIRLISLEEKFLFDLCDYAKSLGCTCKCCNGYDPSIGVDEVVPDHAYIMCTFNGKDVFLFEYDGWERYEYGNIFERERFYIHTFNECKPFTRFEKMVNGLKKMLRMEYYSVPYCLTNQYTRTIIPTIYDFNNHIIKKVRSRYKFSTVKEVKKLMKYMVSENAANLKLRDNYIKKIELTEDFK